MHKRVSHIPTLQEYAKKRRKDHAKFLEINSCSDCDYFKNDLNVCIWGDNIKTLTLIKTCPITNRDL